MNYSRRDHSNWGAHKTHRHAAEKTDPVQGHDTQLQGTTNIPHFTQMVPTKPYHSAAPQKQNDLILLNRQKNPQWPKKYVRKEPGTSTMTCLKYKANPYSTSLPKPTFQTFLSVNLTFCCWFLFPGNYGNILGMGRVAVVTMQSWRWILTGPGNKWIAIMLDPKDRGKTDVLSDTKLQLRK